ncbi:reverse transcriptase [Gossypium australe]|uniref:Reverse transcriptase n=1 Tax=Gossypium australe TaxID=47621 RepID=A0A5B6V9U3_9ROSI|nr:reverse transcriptase [Gossypium australe]
MKREISEFVSRCLVCQQVKAEHQVPSGLLQPVMIPEWKWDIVTMDFVSGLPLSPKKKDKLQEALGTKLNFSTTFHPQTDGQSERVIQILEDMLRCCALEFEGNWEKYLPLVEFAYNNSFQSSINMAPVDLIRETEEEVKVIRDYLKAALDRIEFQIGDKVFLKVSPWKKILHFGRKGKLSPRFIRSNPSYVISPSEIEIQPDMTYNEEPIRIISREVKQLRNKSIALVKVLWQKHGVEEATWEPEEAMRK